MAIVPADEPSSPHRSLPERDRLPDRHSLTERHRSSARHIVEYNLRATRAFWLSFVVGTLATPMLYVLALGVGLGSVVDRHGTQQLGVPYLVYVAPAFLTATALQIAAGDASYPVMAGFKWQRYFHGMAATPLSPRQICIGHLLWVALRAFVNSALYLGVLAAFGGTQSWTILLAVPVATLTGAAFAAPVMAVAATVTSEGGIFNVLFRFVVTPMFLFSGTFYPIGALPGWSRWLAYASPLWHATELARDTALGGLSWPAVAGHLAYLLVLLAAGLVLAQWRFRVRLTR